MTCGIVLLGVFAAVTALGSLIPQQREAMYYVRNYPDQYEMIFRFGLDHVYTGWFFIAVVALLCLNLLLCSLVRFRRVSGDDLVRRAAQLKTDRKPDAEGIAKAEQFFKDHKCRVTVIGNRRIYTKNAFGRWGTFLIHLGILLTVFFFVLGLSTPFIMDISCYPGDSVVLDDGTRIYVDSFSIEDETGKLDYRSMINIRLPDGRETGLRSLSVNHPVGLGQYKVYQQTYGTAGCISVTDGAGNMDRFIVEASDFLSADGKTGILIDNLYPGLEETEEGTTLITSISGSYPDPVYVFLLMEDGSQSAMLAFPGDELETGGYTFRFEDPVEYPGLRIKRSSAALQWLLLGSSLVLMLGLGVTFLMTPVCAVVDDEGYCLAGGKPEGYALALKALTEKEDSHA